MKIKTDKRFSYTIIILRICQLLLIIGIIIQCIRIINFPQAGVGLGIYFIVLLVSLLGEKKITQFIRQEVEEEVEYITSIKDSMFTDIQLPVVIVEEVGIIKW